MDVAEAEVVDVVHPVVVEAGEDLESEEVVSEDVEVLEEGVEVVAAGSEEEEAAAASEVVGAVEVSEDDKSNKNILFLYKIKCNKSVSV